MSQNLRLRLAVLCCVCFVALSLTAQDIHFSQFANAPLNLNPALAGVFGGDGRFVANFRKQWQRVPVPYTTYSGSAEGKLYLQKGRYDQYITGGLLLNSDEQGTLRLRTLLVGLPVSLTMPIAKPVYLTVGVMPAFGQRNFNTDKLTVDAQWRDVIFDPNADKREDQLFSNTGLKYFDLDAGFNLRIQSLSLRNRFDIGGAVHHINRPKHDFWSSNLTAPGNVRLYSKYTLHTAALIQVQPNMDFLFQGLYQRQGGYQEIVYGVGARFHLNQLPYKELALQVGVDRRHRFNDALIPHIELLVRTWTFGFTYDMNWWFDNPEVRLITSGKAGPELSVIYRFFKPRPIPKFKSCPLI